MSALDRLKCIQNNFRQQWNGINCEISGRPGKSNLFYSWPSNEHSIECFIGFKHFSPNDLFVFVQALQTSSIVKEPSISLNLSNKRMNVKSYSIKFSPNLENLKTRGRESLPMPVQLPPQRIVLLFLINQASSLKPAVQRAMDSTMLRTKTIMSF